MLIRNPPMFAEQSAADAVRRLAREFGLTLSRRADLGRGHTPPPNGTRAETAADLIPPIRRTHPALNAAGKCSAGVASAGVAPGRRHFAFRKYGEIHPSPSVDSTTLMAQVPVILPSALVAVTAHSTPMVSPTAAEFTRSGTAGSLAVS